MKKIRIIIFVAISLACTQFSFAQTEKPADSEAYKQALNIYSLALRYSDIPAAKNAVYQMISINPKNVELLDSLAYLYYEMNQFGSVIMVTSDILRINPNNLDMLEMNAICYERIGLKAEALQRYESLYMKTDDLGVLYKMAASQFELKRFNESKTSCELILGSKGIDEIMLAFPVDEGSQNVSIRAAACNLLGMILMEKGNSEEAKKQFNEALKLFPEFSIAKENLASLN